MRYSLTILLFLFFIVASTVASVIRAQNADSNRTKPERNVTHHRPLNRTKMLFEWPRDPPATPQDRIYSRFEQGNYFFTGEVKCFDLVPVGPECKVALVEYDDWSADDYVTDTRIVQDKEISSEGKFNLTMKDDFNDWITPRLELYLQFEWCCSFWTKFGGFLRNNSFIVYTLREGREYADIYA